MTFVVSLVVSGWVVFYRSHWVLVVITAIITTSGLGISKICSSTPSTSSTHSWDPRSLPLDDELRQVLLQYLTIRPRVNEPWLLLSQSTSGKINRGDRINNVWKEHFLETSPGSMMISAESRSSRKPRGIRPSRTIASPRASHSTLIQRGRTPYCLSSQHRRSH